MARRLALLSVFVTLHLIPVVSRAQWQPNGAPVSTGAAVQLNPAMAPDGAGGAIVTWEDTRNDLADIYAQRINAGGAPLWAVNGVIVCAASNPQSDPAVISDGVGGAIITWSDNRNSNGHIYAQRLSATGVALWIADGVPLCTAANYQASPIVVTDGSGGAIVAWQDYRTGADNIYAQRVNAAGVAQWTSNGVGLCTVATPQMSNTQVAVIASDGVGGAIVTWCDTRNGPVFDIYSQRINGAGTVQWPSNGVAICTAQDYQEYPDMISDGIGGAFIAWSDKRRTAASSDIYVQRINAAGVTQWTLNGVALCTAAQTRYNPMLALDGVGGAIISWEDRRGGDADIYVQRVNAAGAVQWQVDGLVVCTAAQEQIWPRIVTDGVGGAIITWDDSRSGPFLYDVYAQRIDASGAALWAPNGLAVSTATEDQQYPRIVVDGAGGAIMAWQDLRNGDYDIYAQRVVAGGVVLTGVRDSPSVTNAWLGRNYPNPFSAQTAFDLALSRDAEVKIDVF
ncbi:MAG TPA: hypothetical protein VJS69_00190, partial [Candidatus Krumholzibacteria bacterium]|nr:hypothetical protein [Candidatus Krumholzibacteria bacterium]